MSDAREHDSEAIVRARVLPGSDHPAAFRVGLKVEIAAEVTTERLVVTRAHGTLKLGYVIDSDLQLPSARIAGESGCTGTIIEVNRGSDGCMLLIRLALPPHPR